MPIPEEQLYNHLDRHQEVMRHLRVIGELLIAPTKLEDDFVVHPNVDPLWSGIQPEGYELSSIGESLDVNYVVDTPRNWDDYNDDGMQWVSFTIPMSWLTDDDYEDQIRKHICKAYIKQEERWRVIREEEAQRNAKILAEVQAEQEECDRRELLRLLEKYPDVR